MSGSDEEVFDEGGTGASPDLTCPRRSARTSGRKRTSTSSAPYNRKAKKKMSVSRTPPPQEGGRPPPENPFASLGGAAVSVPQAGGQENFMAQMQAMMGGMLGGMEGRLSKATNELRSSVTGQLDQALETIGDLNGRVTATEKRLDDVETRLERRLEDGLKSMREALPEGRLVDESCGDHESSTSLSYATALSTRPVVGREERREMDYWAARRTLRFRPAAGEGSAEDAARRFMKDCLTLDDSFLGCAKFKAERFPFGPKTRYRKEVLVKFDTVESRDVARGAASNLAGYGQEHGVRLEIPNFLRPAMKALQNLSFDLKQRHPEAKRNILFDDEAMDLVMDFCVAAGGQWRRVTSEQAKKRKRTAGPNERLNVGDDELDGILGGAQAAQRD